MSTQIMDVEPVTTKTERAATEIEKAKEVVEHQLQVASFIENHKQAIFDKLEENYMRVQKQEQAPLMFIAASLPLISGIVHVGSTLEHFKSATAWVRDSLPEADPVSVLSTLTLIDVVERGWRDFEQSSDDQKRWLWRGIHQGVQALLIRK